MAIAEGRQAIALKELEKAREDLAQIQAYIKNLKDVYTK